jgi:two-component system response regulator AlgR
LKILLADDESLARERLRDLLHDIGGEVQVVAEAANGLQALQLTLAHKPDVALLDINMPGLDGIRCARELARFAESPAVIFITAHDDFALQAFDVAACDYLLKPVRRERLAQALLRAQRFTPNHWQRLQAQWQDKNEAREYVCAQRHGEMRIIPMAEILYFQADQKYTTVKTLAAADLIEEPLKSLEAELAGRFLRIHRNALVALAFIDRLEISQWGGGKLHLRGLPEPLEVSRRCLPAVRSQLKRLGKAD